MRSFPLVLVLLVAASNASARSSSYQAVFTPFELRQMTNDPDTNPTLAKFAEKLGDPAAEAEKVVKLAQEISQTCIGSHLNAGVLQKYQAVHLSNLNSNHSKNAEFQAQRLFTNMTYVDVAELCAGVDYLFGAKGTLLPDAVTLGTGEMDLEPFIRANPK